MYIDKSYKYLPLITYIMSTTYSLDFFLNIFNESSFFNFPPAINNHITNLHEKVTPIVHEKPDKQKYDRSRKDFNGRKNYNKRIPDTWKDNTEFVCTVIEKKEEGVDKWIQDVRCSLNKLSSKNYDVQKNIIIDCINKCVESSTDDNDSSNNIKTIASYIFSTASNNKFFSEIYAKLYCELISTNVVFKDILINYVHNFSNSVEYITYISPDEDYEKYCLYIKQIESRKSSALFICNIMKLDVVPILKVLKILQCYQETILKFIDLDGKNNEIEEMAEIVYIILKECKHCFEECKGEWIWKFIIMSNIDIMASLTKKDKKSLSSRSIFKFKDMKELITKTT